VYGEYENVYRVPGVRVTVDIPAAGRDNCAIQMCKDVVYLGYKAKKATRSSKSRTDMNEGVIVVPSTLNVLQPVVVAGDDVHDSWTSVAVFEPGRFSPDTPSPLLKPIDENVVDDAVFQTRLS
jgi:hypothetical protein